MELTNKPIKAKKHSTYFWNNLDPNFDTSTANRDELLVYIYMLTNKLKEDEKINKVMNEHVSKA